LRTGFRLIFKAQVLVDYQAEERCQGARTL
jgi:hypothetical protein